MRCFYILLLTLVAAGLSKADLGEIGDFYVVSNTETTITVGWTLGPSDQDPIKYTVVEDLFISTDVQCQSPCEHTFEYLEPCSEHQFTVTPFYLVNGAPVTTNTAELNGTTQGSAPDAPSQLVAIDHNHNVDLSWTPPEDTACIDKWQVCWHHAGDSNKTCETTSANTITLHGLEKCAEMIAEVRGVTPDGVYGKLLSDGFSMGYGEPSKIRNLVVGTITNHTVELKWDDPETNPLCVEKYNIAYGPITKMITKEVKAHDNHATISDLQGCTNYKFDVAPISKEGFQAEALSVTAETLETYPLEVGDFEISWNHDPDSININWSPNAEDNCQFGWKICYHDEINPAETCFEYDGSSGEIYDIPLTLESCTKYDVGVSGVSPSGLIGHFTWKSIWTWDEQPSEVQNLVVENVDVNVIEISYDDPAQNARCVDKYELTIDEGEATRTMSTHHDDFFSDLEACTSYEINVTAITRTLMESPVATTGGKTLEGPVSAPRGFDTHDNEITETSISLVWYEPTTNSKCTGAYKLSWTGTSDGSVDIGLTGYQVIYTVDDLVCSGEYDFTLEVTSLTNEPSSDSPVTLHVATLPCSV